MDACVVAVCYDGRMPFSPKLLLPTFVFAMFWVLTPLAAAADIATVLETYPAISGQHNEALGSLDADGAEVSEAFDGSFVVDGAGPGLSESLCK